MALDIKVPTVGESITEVLVAEWLKPEGAWVAQDEVVVALDTDKVNVEIPAPGAGFVGKILKQKGESARVGEVIGTIEPGERPASAAPAAEPSAEAASAPAKSEPPTVIPAEAGTQANPADSLGPRLRGGDDKGASADAKAAPQRVMPAAQRVLAQAKADAAQVRGTGPGGRVLKEDANRYLEGQKIPLIFAEPPPEPLQGEAPPEPKAPPAKTAAPVAVAKAPAPAPVAPRTAPGREEVVPMTPLRKRVAQRLVEAQQTAAILTTFNEIDMSAVMHLRKVHQDAFVQKHGVKLGFMSFFIKASIEALRAYPLVNAEVRGQDIVYKHFYDIGVAVGGGKGLVVPVVRDADALGFADIEKALADFGQRAKTGALKLDELQGGTFTISNGGVYGSMLSTPILNPPQSGILGMHNILERPIGVDGQVVLRPMMYVALSYDHRVVDGREAVGFLVKVKQCIEAPERMLLGL